MRRNAITKVADERPITARFHGTLSTRTIESYWEKYKMCSRGLVNMPGRMQELRMVLKVTSCRKMVAVRQNVDMWPPHLVVGDDPTSLTLVGSAVIVRQEHLTGSNNLRRIRRYNLGQGR